jgi:hypothetical protein
MRNATHRFIAIFGSALALAMSSPASAAGTDQTYLTKDCRQSVDPAKCQRMMTVLLADDTRAFVEWAFGFKLDQTALQSIHDGTVIDFSSDPAGVVSAVKDMDNVTAWAGKHTAADSAMLRSLIEPQLIAAWQADTSASAGTSKTLVAAWRKRNQIIAEGRPPLRRAVVDAYIAMFEFTSKQAGKTVPAAIANHDQFARRIAGQYTTAPPESQMKFNQVQPLWLSLKALWAQATPAQQNAFRAVWRGKPVAIKPPPTAAPQAGLSGNVSAEERYKEHMFVSMESQSIVSSWSNPFIH